MGWLLSIVVAILAGAAGLVGAGAVATACVRWYRISSFEGGSGYFVIGIGLAGAVAGAILGLVIARVVAAGEAPSFFRAFSWSLGAVAGITGIAAMVSFVLADIPPALDGRPLRLDVELRLPVGEALPAGAVSLELASVSGGTRRSAESGTVAIAAARQENGRWIVPGSVPLVTQRGDRALGIEFGGQRREGFLIPVPARPGSEYLQWSEWGPRPPAGSPPWPDTRMSYRFRVQPIESPPPAPEPVDRAQQETAEAEARFAALPTDAPLATWLPFTRIGTPEARRAAAVARIAAHPDLAAELGPLLSADSTDEAVDALRLVPLLPPQPALVAPVAAVGRDLAEAIRFANAVPVEQDPSYERMAAIAQRFSAWREAAAALRERAGGDFTPELGEILRLSRIRTDSYVMQQDIRRVASYWMQQWAGVAPLPGDPPPR